MGTSLKHKKTKNALPMHIRVMHKRVKRVCLRCDKSFMSEGRWNRICPTCRSSNTKYCYRVESAKNYRKTEEPENRDAR